MQLTGQVQNGNIVFDSNVVLPEGSRVCVVVVPSNEDDQRAVPRTVGDVGESVGTKLSKHVGIFDDLPPDAARNHDHYLYGTPKQ